MFLGTWQIWRMVQQRVKLYTYILSVNLLFEKKKKKSQNIRNVELQNK